MVGRSIGTIFAELDLDTSRYVKSQKRLYNDATRTTLNIEANFKKMGIKSSAEFDLMRQKAENAFQRIKNSSQVTSNDIVRAEKAKNEQLKRLNEQQFGSQESLLQGLKKNWLAATAAIAAAWYTVRRAITAASDLAITSARYETLGVAMETVGKNAGYSAEQMAGFQTGLEEAGIAMIGARQSLTRMSQAQLDLSKSSQLARIAQDTAVIGAMNSTEAFNQLVYGIQSANVRVLRTIGINVSWEESYKKMAEQLGRTTTSFTDQEKAQIRLNAVLEAGKRITGTYEAAMTTAGKKMYSLERYIENLKVKIGEGLLPVMGDIVDTTTNWIKSLRPEDIRFMADSIKMLAEAFWGLSKAMLAIPHFLVKIGSLMETEVTVIDNLAEKIKNIPSGKIGYPDMSSLLENMAGAPEMSPGGKDMTWRQEQLLKESLEMFIENKEDLKNAEQSYRQWEMDQLTSSAEYKKVLIQNEHDYAIQMSKAKTKAIMDQEEKLMKGKEYFNKKGLSDLQYTLNTTMNLSQGHNRALFETSKTLATALAVVRTAAGATKAYQDYGYPYGLIAAAAIVAAGAAQIAQIQSQSFDSGGGVAGGAITTTGTGIYNPPTANINQQTPETEQRGQINIYVEGDILGDDAIIERLAERITDGVENYEIRLVASHAKHAESLL